MSIRRSRWVELTDTRSDGEEVLVPFRVKAEALRSKLRTWCYRFENGRWVFHAEWGGWRSHPYARKMDSLDLDRVAIKAADTFREWVQEFQLEDYQTIIKHQADAWEGEVG